MIEVAPLDFINHPDETEHNLFRSQTRPISLFIILFILLMKPSSIIHYNSRCNLGETSTYVSRIITLILFNLLFTLP